MNSRALMVASRIMTRNGRSAINTSRLGLKERPTATTADAAAASLPSSFTWKHLNRFEMDFNRFWFDFLVWDQTDLEESFVEGV